MKIEINNVDEKMLGKIATLIAGTEATIKVIKDEKEKPKKETKKEEPKATIPEETQYTGYVPWQEQWEDFMTSMNWGRK